LQRIVAKSALVSALCNRKNSNYCHRLWLQSFGHQSRNRWVKQVVSVGRLSKNPAISSNGQIAPGAVIAVPESACSRPAVGLQSACSQPAVGLQSACSLTQPLPISTEHGVLFFTFIHLVAHTQIHKDAYACTSNTN